MINIYDKETTMFLVDLEQNLIINFGELNEMLEQLDQSHGNLFVIRYELLSAKMKLQLRGEK
jgi:hypothetical protein